jgi:uncharacterized membrane-anchored protein YhcB (DUF1043 family)
MQFLQLLAAFAVGALLTYGYFKLRSRQNPDVQALRAKLSAKTDELNTYKSDVQEHFVGTAQAIDGLTRSYRSVFDQLEHDAHRLLGTRPFEDALRERAALEQRTPEMPVIDETPKQAERTPQLG